MEQTAQKKVSAKTIIPIILGIVLVGGMIWGIKEYIHFQHYTTTDDAQVDGDISPVVARVGGYVKQIRFKDNQYVHIGDTLVILDDRDYQLKLEQAEAALNASKQNVDVSKANAHVTEAAVAATKAQVDAAKSKLWKAKLDFDRYKNLFNQQAITQAQYDAAVTERDAAEAAYQSALSQYAVASKQVGSSRQEVTATASKIDMEKAAVDAAKLQLSYTIITAPVSGVVSQRDIQIGQLVQPGQNMFAIVNDSSIYVTANFKETQLSGLKPGQPVEIDVDAYPNQKFQGVVSTFSGATGAKFSLLPPDNATGNFVKVVQRVPVRIEFKNLDHKWRMMLRPGLSVNVSVHIKP